MIEINLIPDVKLELLRARRQQANVISISILIAVVSLGVVALLAFYTFAVQAIASGLADNAIESESKQLQEVDDLSKTLTIQAQLGELANMHSDKTVSSRIFDLISTVVPEGENRVAISQLSFDTEENTITIEGEAVNGYEALEVFKKTIDETTFHYVMNGKSQEPLPIATSIIDGDRRYGENGEGQRVLRFTVSFSYPDELFSREAQQGQIIAPTRQNATDSAAGVPKSLFTNSPKDEEQE